VVGNRTIFANGASLAGHVHIEDDVVLGGFALVYQFTRLGMHSFCGFACGVHRDVPPYVTVAGYRAEPYGINAEGLRRRDFSDEEIQAIRRAYKVIYRANLRLEEAVEKVREMAGEWPRIANFGRFPGGAVPQRHRSLTRDLSCTSLSSRASYRAICWASGLIAALKERYPHARFSGIGGLAMVAQGLSLVPLERLAVMGLVEVLRHLPELSQFGSSFEQLLADPPHVFIGIDAPDFNLGSGAPAACQGIPTVHYVSPSVWAWRPWRVRKIARAVQI
jgi:hypothetical protein